MPPRHTGRQTRSLALPRPSRHLPVLMNRPLRRLAPLDAMLGPEGENQLDQIAEFAHRHAPRAGAENHETAVNAWYCPLLPEAGREHLFPILLGELLAVPIDLLGYVLQHWPQAGV